MDKKGKGWEIKHFRKKASLRSSRPCTLQQPHRYRPSLKTRNIGLFQEKLLHSHFHEKKKCLDSFFSESEYCFKDRIGYTFTPFPILQISMSWEPDSKLFPAKLIMVVAVKLPGDPKKETCLHFQGSVTHVGCWVDSD